MPCSRQSSDTGTPPSACFKITMIWTSLYRAVFIENLLRYLAEKILLLNTTDFRGDYPWKEAFWAEGIRLFPIGLMALHEPGCHDDDVAFRYRKPSQGIVAARLTAEQWHRWIKAERFFEYGSGIGQALEVLQRCGPTVFQDRISFCVQFGFYIGAHGD